MLAPLKSVFSESPDVQIQPAYSADKPPPMASETSSKGPISQKLAPQVQRYFQPTTKRKPPWASTTSGTKREPQLAHRRSCPALA